MIDGPTAEVAVYYLFFPLIPPLFSVTVFIIGAKLQNNAEIEKHFWMINAVQPINKGI